VEVYRGSAFIAKIMNKEVPPAADPLGPENLFIVAIGLWRHRGATTGRISVGGKSPLTLGSKRQTQEARPHKFSTGLGFAPLLFTANLRVIVVLLIYFKG